MIIYNDFIYYLSAKIFLGQIVWDVDQYLSYLHKSNLPQKNQVPCLFVLILVYKQKCERKLLFYVFTWFLLIVRLNHTFCIYLKWNNLAWFICISIWLSLLTLCTNKYKYLFFILFKHISNPALLLQRDYALPIFINHIKQFSLSSLTTKMITIIIISHIFSSGVCLF